MRSDLEALATRLAKIARIPVGSDLAVNPPIQRASTLLFDSPKALHTPLGRSYGTDGLAIHAALQEALLLIEGGAGACLTPSGLSACSLALLTAARAGSEIVLPDSVYKPMRRIADGVMARFGVTAHYAPPGDLAAHAALIGPRTAAVVMESPGSLSMELQDVPAIVSLAQAHGAVTILDNTWSAGVFFKPFAHGVDYVVQALTKYQNGHADVLMGAVLARTATQAERLTDTAYDLGLIVSPDDAYLALRGLRTMPLRLARQEETGFALARYLADRQEVASVLHPGLESHPDHALWRRDFTGAAGVFSFTLAGSPSQARVDGFLRQLTLFELGYSWGGYESLIVPCDDQLVCRGPKAAGYDGPLLRISAGLEAPDALIADLDQALTGLG
jgi:cystathionine beta-lyase